ncbi:hypothetical protein ACIA5E_22105 [Nocardia asteroides]|uniref:hypothetical protein n=1 Tax=Nocardia asteroides TaxID=1824 RepID=UPI00378B74D7
MFDHIHLSLAGKSTAGFTQVSYNSTLDRVSVLFGTHEVRLSVTDAAAMADAIVDVLDTYTSNLQVVW